MDNDVTGSILSEELTRARETMRFMHESEMIRQERKQRRLVYVILVLIATILVMNLAWIYAWTQYDYDSFEAKSLNGNANIIGEDGDIYNGSDSEI